MLKTRTKAKQIYTYLVEAGRLPPELLPDISAYILGVLWPSALIELMSVESLCLNCCLYIESDIDEGPTFRNFL